MSILVSDDYSSLVVGQELAEAVRVEVIDHVAEGICLFVHLGHRFLQVLDENLRLSVMNEDVVGSDTELTTVDESKLGQLHRRELQIRRLVDNTGTLSTEFQDAGSEVLRCGLSHQLTFLGASGENDQIHFRRSCFNRDLNLTFNALESLGVQVTSQQFFHDCRRVG